MNIVIIGAGAMGGLFGALLSPFCRVTLIDTDQTHVDAINDNGLRLTRLTGGHRDIPVRALSDPDRYDDPADVAVIFTKSHATEAAARTAERILAPDGVALSLQNGIGNQERIAAVLGAGRTVVGVTSQAGTLVGPGHVRHAGTGPTYLAAGADPDPRILRLAASLRHAGIETELSPDVDRLIWGKLIINVGINALAALLRVPNGVIGATPACVAFMEQVVDEAVAVAAARRIALPYPDPLAQVRRVCADTAKNRASMLQDILRGNRTEIDVINGAIVRMGREAAIPTPANALVTDLIRALEATAADRIFNL